MPEDGLDWTGRVYDNTARSARTPGGTSRSSSSAASRSELPSSDHAARHPRLADAGSALRWLMSSDVCKHCTHAGCLDVCPTGALFRTEFGTVVVQEDICNGCGYCVPACPFGVIDRRELPDETAAAPGRPGLEVHALLRPAQGRPRAGVREGVPDRLDPVRRARRAARARGRAAREAARPRAGTARGSTATTRTTASAASARSSCCSTSPRSTACRPTRSCRRATCPSSGARRRSRRARCVAGVFAIAAGSRR